jgi:hypothetical protein
MNLKPRSPARDEPAQFNPRNTKGLLYRVAPTYRSRTDVERAFSAVFRNTRKASNSE